jgi:3-oxoacyl-[acyl-carrier-protein] synthase III
VLSYTMCPDDPNVPSACIVHKNLGLPERCYSMKTDAVCNSFIMQLTLAEQLIRGGVGHFALLTQSSAITRMRQTNEPHEAWFGDGATAVVVGPVSAGRGLLGYSHHTDGELHDALLLGVPGGGWYDGAAITYSPNRRATRMMLLTVADRARQVVTEAMDQAGIRPTDVDYYAGHQATVWMPRVTQEHIGLSRAKRAETCAWAGTLSAANVPMGLWTGVRDGNLKEDNLVAMFSGGTGTTWSGAVLRWGT